MGSKRKIEKKSIKVFLASSYELKNDRDGVEIAIRRKNNVWQLENKPYIDLQIWETCSDGMSPTRSQDEYNKIIKTTDIFILLLWTKAGKYTQEEFELAHQLFMQTEMPKIIVYQKNSNDIEKSLSLFLEKFREEGKEYFHGHYNNFSELELNLNKELDILFNNKYPSDLDLVLQNRLELLGGLERRYKNRLKKKMETELSFKLDLQLQYTKEGTTKEFAKDYFIENLDEKSINGFHSLFIDFERKFKRLLILGEPGSGKTVLLLEFGLSLIRKALNNPKYPLPILLNLATWRDDNQNFESWLEQNLIYATGEYGTSKQYAKELVSENNLLLLLDGLDEIPKDNRNSCLIKLKDYLIRLENSESEGKFPQVIICSRNAEYKDILANAPVKASLLITPLTNEYVINALKNKRANTTVNVLLHRIEDKPEIAKKLNTAFELHMALHLAHCYNFDDLSPEHLLDAYVMQEVGRLIDYEPKNAYYLHYLAEKISKTKKVNSFEMLDLRPDFLKNIFLFNFISGFFWGFFFYITLSILNEHRLTQTNFSQSLLISLITGFFFAILGGLNKTVRKNTSKGNTHTGKKAWYKKKLIRGSLIGFCVWQIVLIIFIVNDIIKKESRPLENYFIGFPILSVFGLILELIYLFFKFFISSFFKIINNSIETQELLEFNISKWQKINFKQGISEGFAISFLVGIIVLLFTVVNGVMDDYQYRNFINVEGVKSHETFFTAGNMAILPIVLLLITLCGFVFGLYRGLVKSFFINKKYPRINNPYLRLYAQIKYDFLQWFLIIFTYFFVVSFIGRIPVLNIVLYPLIISLSIAFLSSPLYKHIILRCLLFFKGNIPANLGPFLDEVSKTGLMEKDGGQWRFRHQLVQDYFADKAVNSTQDGSIKLTHTP